MSYPCVDPAQFDVVDGAFGPKDHLQWRHVARAGAASVTYTYPAGALAYSLLLTAAVQWTNDTPINQVCYCLATRGSTRITATAPEVNLLETRTGVTSGAAPATPTTTSVSTMGCGPILGADPSSPANSSFGVMEVREPQRSMLVGNNIVLPPTHTMKVLLEIYAFKSAFGAAPIWPDVERNTFTGVVVLDLFAYPDPAVL